MDGDEGQGNDLKAVAKRRAEQARRAGSHTSESLTKTLYRVFASAGNKLGITVCIHEILRTHCCMPAGQISSVSITRLASRETLGLPVDLTRRVPGFAGVVHASREWTGRSPAQHRAKAFPPHLYLFPRYLPLLQDAGGPPLDARGPEDRGQPPTKGFLCIHEQIQRRQDG